MSKFPHICKFISLVVLGFMSTQHALAQVLSVRDQVTQQPLEMVQLYTSNPAQVLMTDHKGQTDITPLQGTDSIAIRLVGYQPKMLSYEQLQRRQFRLYLQESTVSLQAVVVSATRWQQDAKEVPQKVSTIHPKDVLLKQPQTAADMLGQSGEVFIQKSQGGGGSPMIRGFATNRVLIAVDGVRMNTAIFRSGNLQNVISLDPFAVGNTEVLFGPGSVMYGSDAIGGVMSFYTLTPKFAAAGEATRVAGSATGRWSSANQEKTGHVDLSLGLKRWAFLTSATFSDYGDLRIGSCGPDEYLRKEYVKSVNGQDEVVANPDPERQADTGYDQLNLMQKVRYSPGENWELQYGFHYSTTSDVPRYDRLINYRNGKLRSAEWYYGPQVWLMNNLQATYRAASNVFDQLKIGLAHQHFEESRHNRDLGKAIRYNRYEKVNAYSANLDLEKALGQGHHLFYGLEAIYNKVQSTGTDENISTGGIAVGPSRYPDGADWGSYAAFMTHRLKVGERLTVLSGVRYSHVLLHAGFDKTFYDFPFSTASINSGALTGSAGMVYSPASGWQLSSNLSTGFRAPNVDDIGKVFDSAPGLVVVPNPDLKPEYAYNADVGIAKVWHEVVKLDATAFYTYLQDALVRRGYTWSGQSSMEYEGELSQVQAIQNAAYATVWGVQAGLELKFPAGFGFASRYNLQRGREELDEGSEAPLRHAAPSFGVTRLMYTRNRLKADLYAMYNGEIKHANLAPEEREKAYLYATDQRGNPYSPAWATLNLKVLYQVSRYLAASAGIENISDQRYRPYSSGIAAPGRNFVLSLRANL